VKVGDLVRKKQPSKFKGYGIIVREGSPHIFVVVWSDGGPPLHTTKRSLLPLV
jgi:hypothetical protein